MQSFSQKFEISPVVDLDDWARLNDLSPQGSIFTDPEYLKALGRPFELFFIKRGGEVRAGLALFPDGSHSTWDVADYVAHHGILFAPPKPAQRECRYTSEQFQILTFAVEEFFSKYEKIKLNLSPSISDLRPFLWHNFHEAPEIPRYRVHVRYTSHLNIEDFKRESFQDSIDFSSQNFKKLADSRREVLKRAAKEGGKVEMKFDGSLLRRLYKRGVSNVAPKDLRVVSGIASTFHKLGRARMFSVRNAKGKPEFVALYLIHGSKAYYVFGAGDPDIQGSYSGTLVHWQAFQQMAVEGIEEVDFVGVNSPSRGAFKLSFGGKLVPYYQVVLDKTNVAPPQSIGRNISSTTIAPGATSSSKPTKPIYS